MCRLFLCVKFYTNGPYKFICKLLFPFTNIFRMSLEFCVSDKQVIPSPPPGDAGVLVLPWKCGVSGSAHLKFCWWNTARWSSGWRLHFAASRAASTFLFAHLQLPTPCRVHGCEMIVPCFHLRFPDTVLSCVPWPFGFPPLWIASFSLRLWFVLLTSKCYFLCVCDLDISVCVAKYTTDVFFLPLHYLCLLTLFMAYFVRSNFPLLM